MSWSAGWLETYMSAHAIPNAMEVRINPPTQGTLIFVDDSMFVHR